MKKYYSSLHILGMANFCFGRIAQNKHRFLLSVRTRKWKGGMLFYYGAQLRVVKKIESSMRDGKSNWGDFAVPKHWHARHIQRSRCIYQSRL